MPDTSTNTLANSRDALRTDSLAVQIEELLRRDIVTGVLEPGVRISVEEMSKRLGVSTTPIRDAMNGLAREGLIRVEPRKGVFVETCDPSTLKEIYAVRIALECLAIRAASLNASENEIQHVLDSYEEKKSVFDETGDIGELMEYDNMVHDLVAKHCGNSYLGGILDNMRTKMVWARTTVETRTANSYLRAFPEHVAILKAMKRRDPDMASDALRRHLELTLSAAIGESAESS